MARIYTIVKVGWEYDDVNYNETGLTPTRAYKSIEAAEKACNDLNIEAYQRISTSSWEHIGRYINDWETIKDIKLSLNELGVTVKGYNIKLPKKATYEQWTYIIALIDVIFYQIMPIEYIDKDMEDQMAKRRGVPDDNLRILAEECLKDPALADKWVAQELGYNDPHKGRGNIEVHTEQQHKQTYIINGKKTTLPMTELFDIGCPCGCEWFNVEALAAYLAAIYPKAILDLLNERDQLQNERDDLQNEVEKLRCLKKGWHGMPDEDCPESWRCGCPQSVSADLWMGFMAHFMDKEND